VLSPYRVNHRPLKEHDVEPTAPDGIILLVLIVVLLLTYKFS
jgi:hypothetical protein